MHMILQVQQGQYPFGQGGLKVEDYQAFTSLAELQQKERHMIKRNQMLNSPHVVRLLGVNRKGLVLKYSYQYIPHSLTTYVEAKYKQQNGNWMQKKGQVVKKMGYEITMLVGFLARMRVQTELSSLSLGVTQAQKIKIFLGPKARMGIRSELFLIAHYRKARQELINYVNQLVENVGRTEKMHQQENPTPKISSQQQRDRINPFLGLGVGRAADDRNWGSSSQDMMSSFDWGKQSSELQWGGQRMPQKVHRKSLEKSVPFHNFASHSKRKMSVNNLQFEPHQYTTGHEENLKDHRRNAKYSFNIPNPPSSFEEAKPSTPKTPQQDYSSGPTRKKSIRIQFEQQPGSMAKGKKRKDSYKVKITTYRQYEVEQPDEIFKNGQQDEDSVLFDYFATKARKQAEKQDREPSVEQHFQGQDKCHDEEIFEDDSPVREKRLSTQADPSNPSSSPLKAQRPNYPANSMCAVTSEPLPHALPSLSTIKLKKTTSTDNITEKIRLAKQRSTQMIEKIRQMKK